MPLSPELARWLRENEQDAVHASELGMASAPDEALIELALREDRTIITRDLGFPRRLAASGASAPGVILFGGGGRRTSEVAARLDTVFALVEPEELQRSVVVVEPGRIRVRPLPLTRT